MTIELVTKDNFTVNSLDVFDRKQQVNKVYKKSDKGYEIVTQQYLMDWSLEKKREIALDLLSDEYISYVAKQQDKIIGFISVNKTLVEDYLVVDLIQVDKNERRQGLGRKLFDLLIHEGHKANAKGLYISACSSEEVLPNYLAIAQKAVSMINKNDVIYITSASVGYLMAENMPQDLACTVVTNSISIADCLRKYEKITVIILGGELQSNGNVYDGFAIDILKRLRFDQIFITSARVSVDFGLSIQRNRALSIYHTLLSGAKKVIGLYPAGKIGTDSVVSICPIDSLDVLITDDDALEEDLKKIEEKNVRVMIAES